MNFFRIFLKVCSDLGIQSLGLFAHSSAIVERNPGLTKQTAG